MSKILKFPNRFLWGAATSAHQVEGNNLNDWTEWEKENAGRLSKESGGKYSGDNYISGMTCDNYNRYEEDFDLAKSMNNNAHRFSIEWSRIEPEEGKFDEVEIEHYRKVIHALHERGIEPFVTLWHWTMPVWFTKLGAFEKRENIKYFVRFFEFITLKFKNEVKFWIILNEPEIYSSMSYFKGAWPPQKKNLISCLSVIINLIRAHRESYKIIKKIKSDAQIGIAKNIIYFEGWLAPVINWWWNFYFLNKLRNYQDFIGLNYYYLDVIHFVFGGGRFGLADLSNPEKNISDMGWEIYPEGIYHVLKSLKKYNKPIYITENGLADAQDKQRANFIVEHLKWVHKAIEESIDVRGYFHWSLLDNFEWDKGFWPRFGLIEIDYKTLERKPRPSSRVYAEIAKSNAIDIN